MSKQPPPAPTASTIGPCPTVFQVSKTPRHWKFTQHLRTTRPPPYFGIMLKAGLFTWIRLRIKRLLYQIALPSNTATPF